MNEDEKIRREIGMRKNRRGGRVDENNINKYM
jgi:hypothetical protein